MERTDEKMPLLHLHSPQVMVSEHTSDGTVDINKQPALKQSTGNWRACFFILGVEFSNCVAFYAISTNLVTYLTNVLHESKISAAKNASAWVGAYFLTPLLGAFIADTYLGQYWTAVAFLPVYVVGMMILTVSASLSVFSAASQGADQFDINDPVERVKKGSFFNWYYVAVSASSLLSGTVLVWLQDNVGWGVGFAIPMVLLLSCLPAFVAASGIYRFRRIGVSPLKSLSQVVVASIRNCNMKLPDDRSLLYELNISPSTSRTNARHVTEHTNQFRFFDKAAIVPPASHNNQKKPMSSWRLCTVTQVEELKMLLRMSPTWASFVMFYAVDVQITSTLVEQGMVMDNRIIGQFAIPPATLSTVTMLSSLIWVPVYEAVLVPLARHVTGNAKGFSQLQRLGTGLALSMLTMVYSALVEMQRLAIAEASGLTNQSVPVPMSILWQLPAYILQGAAEVFGFIGVTEFFYDHSPETMKSLCAAFGQLAISSGSFLSSLLLSFVSVVSKHGTAPGWIPDNLNEGHLDYFFWMMAALSFLNLVIFVSIAQ
ncbi:hypothetical protein QOZ80_6AG0541540 [Eleusine coracana subsp. coracana]|nr:hypothetical protein QOZ80_6AG0541540 [Eleusine coracana subsp. coracana]